MELEVARNEANGLLDDLKDASEYGSIINVNNYNWQLLRQFANNIKLQGQIGLYDMEGFDAAQGKLLNLIAIGEVLAQKYDVVVTNPPYLGNLRFSLCLDKYVKKNFPSEKSDLSMVMFKCALNRFSKENGFIAFITTTSWMFLSSFEKLREYLISNFSICSLVDFGTELFDGKVGHNPIVSWVTRKLQINYKLTGIRLIEYCYSRRNEKESEFFNLKNRYIADQTKFSKIPGSPIAYWVSKKMLSIFEKGNSLGSIADSKQGIATANNEYYLRHWNEVDFLNIKFNTTRHENSFTASEKWYPYNKGGDFRKWYGNNDYVINWLHDGEEIKKDSKAVLRNLPYHFRNCFSWSLISSSVAAFRYKPYGHLFDVAGMSCFSNSNLEYLLALCNSKIVMEILKIIAPTLNYQCGDIANITVIFSESKKETIESIVRQNISLSKSDWDSFETSWDFKEHPLVKWACDLWDATAIAATMDYYYGYHPKVSCPLELCFMLWQGECNKRFTQLKTNEEELAFLLKFMACRMN